MMSDHQHFGPGTCLPNLPGRLQSIQVGHADINDDDVRIQLRALFHSLTPGAGFPADLPARVLFDEHFQAFPNYIMIVGY